MPLNASIHRMSFLRSAFLAFSCLLAAPGTASDLPSLGDASSSIVSPEQEYLLGRAWLSLLRGQVPHLSDAQLKDYVETSVYRLSETSQVQDRRLEFILIDSDQLNAFAAPGGIIGVNAGLFLYAETEAEYAAVLAHELAHLSQRHFARGLEAQEHLQVPVMATMLAGIIATVAGAGDAGIAAIASSQAGAMQAMRRFSRQNEQEADRIGLLNLEKAGYDPRAMPSMFERLMRQYRYDAKPPEFLLTHPVTESRIADTRNRAEQYHAGGRQDDQHYQLMRARVQLVYEQTNGMAVKRFRAQLDASPKSSAARYGLVLALTKSGRLNEAREALKPLLDKSPNNIDFNLAAAALDITANRLKDAESRVGRLLALYPGSYPLRQTRVDLLLKQNQPAAAEKVVNELLASRPHDPDVWYLAAEVRGLSGDIIGVHQARAEYFALVGNYDQAIEQLDFAKRRASGNFQLAARMDARQQALREEKKMLEEMMR